jgi:hypothetical protein
MLRNTETLRHRHPDPTTCGVARAHGPEELDPVAEREGCEGACRAMQPLDALVQLSSRVAASAGGAWAATDPLKRGISGRV